MRQQHPHTRQSPHWIALIGLTCLIGAVSVWSLVEYVRTGEENWLHQGLSLFYRPVLAVCGALLPLDLIGSGPFGDAVLFLLISAFCIAWVLSLLILAASWTGLIRRKGWMQLSLVYVAAVAFLSAFLLLV